MNDWTLYDYVDRRGDNIILKWMQSLQVPDRARLKAKMDMLRKNGPDLPTGLLSDTRISNIKKIRVNGRVALRPMLCRGPIWMDKEFTFLLGATERDGKLSPIDAPEIADRHRAKVRSAPSERRVIHDRNS